MEQDRNNDGKPDLRLRYKDGRREKLIRDDDFDGRFENTQRFNLPGWQVVVEIDNDGDRNIDTRFFYQDDVLRIKEEDATSNGDGFLREYYDAKGALVKSEEAQDAAGPVSITWYFDQDGNPVRAEKDSDKDGRVNVWFYYEQGRVIKVEEDSNHDGKVDVWETYDGDEQMSMRKKDLDFDGVADVEETF